MSKPRYDVAICWSDEDDAFVAEVPDLPGCAADGATRRDALTNVEVAIDEWIAIAREIRRAVPLPMPRLSTR